MLLDIKHALLLKDIQEIDVQINIRNKLISEMVGTLYPSILKSEVDKLYKRIQWVRSPAGDFQI